MNGKTYHITDTRQVDSLTQAGNTVTVYRVWLVTDRGATGTVDVNKSDWSAEKLAAILASRAAELDLAYTVTES
jgi:hypothetical protein